MTENVEEYLETFEPDVQGILQNVRLAIHRGVPGASEEIHEGVPAILLGDRCAFHFGGTAHDVRLSPVPHFDGPLEADVSPYRAGDGAVHFLYTEDVPYELIQHLASAIGAQHLQAQQPTA